MKNKKASTQISQNNSIDCNFCVCFGKKAPWRAFRKSFYFPLRARAARLVQRSRTCRCHSTFNVSPSMPTHCQCGKNKQAMGNSLFGRFGQHRLYLKQGDAKNSGCATRWLQHCFLWVLRLPLTKELTDWLSRLRHCMPRHYAAAKPFRESTLFACTNSYNLGGFH